MGDASLGLHSSKRKFYKLLDNLSSSRVQLPAHNNASTTTLADPPSKRSRLLGKSRPTTAPSSDSPTRLSTSGTRPRSSIFAIGGNTRSRPKSVVSERGVMVEVNRKTPNYAPWSHEQFLSRLKTFADVRTWTPKPPAVGEVEWAKRGWVVVGKDTVGCKGGCEKRLVVKVAKEQKEAVDKDEEDDDWWTGDLEGQMVERYKGLIIEAHAEDCLWRKKGCDENIYSIKMAEPVTWQTELRERYLSLLAIESALPASLDVRTQEMEEAQTAFDVGQLKDKIPVDVLTRPNTSTATDETPEDPPLNLNPVALTMALTGWSGQSQSSIHLAYCTKCFQRAGLWLYSRNSSNDSSAPEEESLFFNPIEQHREHCPWKNATTQVSTGRLEGMPGWQVLTTLIKGYRKPDGRNPTKKAPSRPVSVYTEDGEEEEDWTKGREEREKEDKERRSRLQKLKRAFSLKKGNALARDKSREKENAGGA